MVLLLTRVTHVLTDVTGPGTLRSVIKSFQHKGLEELFLTGSTRRIHSTLHRRCLRRLDALDQAKSIQELNLPGFNFHSLRGSPKRYSLHVNGPWCITFEWRVEDAYRVDLEQYH